MSLFGLEQFKSNLEVVIQSPAFNAASDGQRLEIVCRLLNSKHGLGSWLSGRVHPLTAAAPMRESE